MQVEVQETSGPGQVGEQGDRRAQAADQGRQQGAPGNAAPPGVAPRKPGRERKKAAMDRPIRKKYCTAQGSQPGSRAKPRISTLVFMIILRDCPDATSCRRRMRHRRARSGARRGQCRRRAASCRLPASRPGFCLRWPSGDGRCRFPGC